MLYNHFNQVIGVAPKGDTITLKPVKKRTDLYEGGPIKKFIAQFENNYLR